MTDNPNVKTKHYSSGKSFRGKAGEMRRLYTETAEMSSEEFEDWLHELFGVESLLELDPSVISEEVALKMIDQGLREWFGGEPSESNEKGANLDESENQGITEPEINIESVSEPRELTTVVNNSNVVNRSRTTIAPQTSIAFKIPTPEEHAYLIELCKNTAGSKFFPSIDTFEKAYVLAMQAFTLDVNPFSAFQGIYVIPGANGSLSLYYSTVFLKALADKSRLFHRFDIVTDNHKCVVTTQRRDRSSVNVYTYTIDQAQAANLLNKQNWKSNPRQMLTNRCIMAAIKAEAPEVIFSFLGAGATTPDDDDLSDVIVTHATDGDQS